MAPVLEPHRKSGQPEADGQARRLDDGRPKRRFKARLRAATVHNAQLAKWAPRQIPLADRRRLRQITASGWPKPDNKLPLSPAEIGESERRTARRRFDRQRSDQNAYRHDQRWCRDLLQGLGFGAADRFQPWLAALRGRLGRADDVLLEQGLPRHCPRPAGPWAFEPD